MTKKLHFVAVCVLAVAWAAQAVSPASGNIIATKRTKEIAIAAGKGSQAAAGSISIQGGVTTAGAPVQDEGTTKSEQRVLPAFSAVKIEGFPGKVIIRTGMEPSASVTADAAFVAAVSTHVAADGTLAVSLTRAVATAAPMIVELQTGSISSLQIDGAADVVVEEIKTDTLRVAVKGSASCTVSGAVRTLEAAVAGSGDLECSRLRADDCTVAVQDAGDASIQAAKSLHANASGAGSIVYHGMPAKITKNISGAGSITPVRD